MCGIAGFCNMPENWKENISRMNEKMIHRGPDMEGMWANSEATVVLGHRRLSILDLSESGTQPMISADDRYVMVLNGEIYNYKDLSQKLLEERKLSFLRGHSDTEVLVEFVSAYGFQKAIESAKGMFAVAVYDRLEKKLYMARDRIGEKPLYYGFVNGKFMFASDIGALRAHEHFDAELDMGALGLYFRHGYIPAPYTVYKNFKKLEAGSILEVKYPYEQARQYKYWDIMDVARHGQDHLFEGSEEEATDRLEELLRDSIRHQMVADVPVGAFLSGGIDSTTVVAIMQAIAPGKIKSFSIGFEEKEYDEAQYAKESAEYLGTDHTELYVSEKEALEAVSYMPQIYTEPFADPSQIPTYLVSRLAREKVTVSLSGDGGDELFCGYDSYAQIRSVWNKIGNIPAPFRKVVGYGMNRVVPSNCVKLRKVGSYISAESPEAMYRHIANVVPGTDQLLLDGCVPDCKQDAYPTGYLGKQCENNLMLMNLLMYHPDDILVKMDRASMAVSLESRIPLLDKDIVEFAWKLPLSYKVDGRDRKKVLKNVLYRYIPKAMMERPKRGFAMPLKKWLQTGMFRPLVEDVLLSDTVRQDGILNTKVIDDMWKHFLRSGWGDTKIWNLLMFQVWRNANRN